MDEIQAGTFTFRERLYHWFFVILLLVSYSSGQVVPDPPKNVSLVTKGSRTIEISWMASFNGNSAIQNYTVEIGEDKENFTDAGCQGTLSNGTCVVSNSTNASLTRLFPFTKYFIRVFATNAIGRSNSSSVVNVTTDEEEPTAAPVNVRGHKTSSTSILVEWDDVPDFDQNGIITSYNITYRSKTENHDGFAEVGPNERQKEVTDLREYVEYDITVRASTSKGDGPDSSPITVRTDQDEPNSSPQGVQASAKNSTSVSVSWAAVGNEQRNGIIKGYKVIYQALPDGRNVTRFVNISDEDQGKEQDITLGDLVKFTNYSIRVLAFTVVGDGPPSEVKIVQTQQDKPTAAPANVVGQKLSSKSILVTWNEVPPADQHGIITSYNVTYQSLTENHSNSTTVDYPAGRVTLSDLKEFVNYSIIVFASTKIGDGPASDPVYVKTDEDKPTAAPSNVRGHNTSSTSILVEWDNVPAYDQNGIITSYNITYRSQTEEHNGFAIAGPNDLQKNLTNLREYVDYDITVRASTLKGDGPDSNPAIVVKTDQDKPTAPPANIRGHNTSSTSILVEWREVPPADQNGVILTYTISYQSLTQNDNSSKTVGSSIQKLNLTELKEFVDYNITLFASTVKGNGKLSDPFFVITDQDKPTAAPVSVRGHKTSSTSILVEWDDVPAYDQNGIITSYNITYRSQTEEHKGFAIAGPNDLQKNLTDLREYVDYNITVRASTSKGDGPDSSPAIVVRTDQDRPSAAPQNLRSINTTSTSIFVTWEEVLPDEQNGIIISYNVSYRAIPEAGSAGPLFSKLVMAPTRHVNLTDLTRDMHYNVSVLASTIKGDGKYRNPKKLRTNEDRPGAPPQNVQGYNTSSTSIRVTWKEVPEDKQHGDIISYTVMYKRTTNVTYKSVEVTPISGKFAELNGLDEYTFYDIKVLAATNIGNGPASNPIKVQTDEDKPSASPVNVKGQNASSTSILVEWGEVPSADQNGVILTYTVSYQSLTQNDVGNKVLGYPASQTELTGLKKFVNYSITVLASTVKGSGKTSDPIFVITDQDRPSAAPQNLRSINSTSTSIFVRWDEVLPDEQNGIIISYNVSYRAIPEAGSAGPFYFTKVMAPTRQVNLTSLTKDMHYNVSVLASTSKGDGNYSDPKTFRTNDRPSDPPQRVRGVFTSSTSIMVKWDVVREDQQHGDIIYYTVRYKKLPNGNYKETKVTSRSVELKELDKFTVYKIEVLATTRVGDGPPSEPIEERTDEDKPEGPPQSVTVTTVDSSSIKVTWKPVLQKFRHGVITQYIILYNYSSEGKPLEHNVSGKVEEAVVGGLKQSTKYTIRVLAATVKGRGPPSSPKSATAEGKPDVKDLPERTIFQVGDVVVLTCEATGEPKPSVTWSKDGNTSIPRAQFRNDDHILVIQEVARSDGGIYECTASNIFGQRRTATVVIIAVPPSIIKDISPRSVLCAKETPCSLLCHATGDIPFNYSWTRNSQALDGHKIKVMNNIVIITPLDDQDYGDYVCHATNSFGSTSYKITLSESREEVNNEQSIFRASDIAWSCIVFVLLVLIGVLIWRLRRAQASNRPATAKKATVTDTVQSVFPLGQHVSEPASYMELRPRPSDGQTRVPPEYQSLQGSHVNAGYYNVVPEEGNKGGSNEEIYEEIELSDC